MRLKYPVRVVFSTLFSMFYLVVKHCISCLSYYYVVIETVYLDLNRMVAIKNTTNKAEARVRRMRYRLVNL